MTTKPWRERVEMWLFAWKGGGHKVLTGFYSDSPGQSQLGTFGGGIKLGENCLQAAARELVEESGFAARWVHDIPVRPLLREWRPPFDILKQEDHLKQYKGSRTTSYWGGLSNAFQLKSFGQHTMIHLDWRNLEEVIASLEPYRESDPRAEYRLNVLKYLNDRVSTDF